MTDARQLSRRSTVSTAAAAAPAPACAFTDLAAPRSAEPTRPPLALPRRRLLQSAGALAVAGGPAAGAGPVASGSFINVDFSKLTGAVLKPTLFGNSMASDGDFTLYGDANVQNAAKHMAGFGLPGMYARINTNDTSIDGSGNPNLTYVDRVSAAMPNIIDMNKGTWSYELGGGNGNYFDPTGLAEAAKTIAQRFISNGTPCMEFELFNERDGTDIGTISSCFNAVADALHSVDASIRLIGTNDAWMNGGRMRSLQAACGSKIARFHYHCYSVHSGVSDADCFQNAIARYTSDAAGLRSYVGGTIPSGVGEYNMDGKPPGDARQEKIQGAVFNSLAVYSAFTADPLLTHGALWDWLGDGYYGVIVDPHNPPGNALPAYSVMPAGYANKNCRQYMAGHVVSSTVPSGNLKCLATKNGTRASLWLINYDTAASFSGRIAMSAWPVNRSGNGTLTMLTVSPSHPMTNASNLTVKGGLTRWVTIPAMSVVVLTIGAAST